jgi:hypothetical protein
MVKIHQRFDSSHIEAEKIPQAVLAELSRPELQGIIKPGKRIAVTCGSRGVANIALITRAIVGYVTSQGAKPFVVPAMGSHGGATAEGQRAILTGYGVTEEFIGCPILSSMETVEIGQSLEPMPTGPYTGVRIDKYAAESDGIIVVGRIKPHTDFRGPYESGLMKMMAIGLGKREGADICHQLGYAHMAVMVLLFGRTIIRYAPVILGFGIVENAYDQTFKVAAMRADEIEAREPPLLEEARRNLPYILFDKADVLVVDRIGKNISGTGMDPNITGAGACAPFVTGGITVCRTVILDLTPETHGAALGIGAAHVITRRLFEQIDYDATWVNAITSRAMDYARIPVVAESDSEAIRLALKTCTACDTEHPRIVRIPDSLHTGEIYVSESMAAEAQGDKRISILSGLEDWPFDKNGNLW